MCEKCGMLEIDKVDIQAAIARARKSHRVVDLFVVRQVPVDVE